MAAYEVQCENCRQVHRADAAYDIADIVTTCPWCGDDLCPACGKELKAHEDCALNEENEE